MNELSEKQLSQLMDAIDLLEPIDLLTIGFNSLNRLVVEFEECAADGETDSITQAAKQFCAVYEKLCDENPDRVKEI